MLNKKEIKRLLQLEEQATSLYLDKTDFNVSDWLDYKEAKEYRKLIKKDEK
jgi:hypothetical protein